jgi:PAS domain S-box-containing protein
MKKNIKDTNFLNNTEQMKLFPLSLSFRDNNYESKFQDFYYDLSLNLVRNALLLGLFLYSSFAILDYYLVPDLKHIFWFLRFVIIAPPVLITYILTYTKFFKKNFQLLMAINIIIAGINISVMILMATGVASYSYYAGIMLVLIYCYTVSKLRFIWASVVGLIIIVSYEIISLSLLKTSTMIFVNNNFFLVGANFLGMLACYTIEYTTRKNFFLLELLEIEQQKTKNINASLEDKVINRTKKITETLQDLTKEINTRRLAEEKNNAYNKELELITNTALDFVRLTPQINIYNVISKKLFELIGISPITISSYENSKLILKSIHFNSKLFDKVIKLIGFNPIGLSSDSTDEIENLLLSGKLIKIAGGFQEFTSGGFSQTMSSSISKLLNIKSIYAIGLTSNGKLFGSINIILRGNSSIVDKKNLIELYAQLVSIAIQRDFAIKDLKISEEKNTTVVENMGEGIGIVNSNEEFIYVNKAAEVIFGVEPGTLISQNLKDFLSPESALNVLSRTSNKLENDLLSTYDLEIIRPNGEIRFITVTSSLSPNRQTDEKEIIGIFRDNTIRIKAEQKTLKALNEKEILLKEVFHRVKNNLQIITSILRMQAQLAENESVKTKLQKSVDRIHSMALVQSKLFQSGDFENINIPSYISGIVANLISTNNVSPGKIKINYNIEDIRMDVNMATPCGMIVSEIISNSIQHAFPNDAKGEIGISFKFNSDQFHLELSDNGIGLPQNFDVNSKGSIGFILVNTLVSQLRGNLDITSVNGTKIIITFNNQDLKTFSKIK